MAMHESQSLFVEKQLGRNPAFWEWALPMVEQHLGESWSEGRHPAHVHLVERGLIRVDADEVTYPLHVILRFELEQELVAGRLDAGGRSRSLGRQDARLSRPVDRSTIPPTARCRTCTGRAAPSAISRPTRSAP